MSAITQKFMGFTNQIAVDLGLMSREQSVEILSIQARFLALAEKGIKPTERFIDADPLFEQVRSSWQNLAMENQISETDFLHHYARASSGKGFEKDEAPASGDIANALKFVSKDAKNAILTAQAAVRAEQVYLDTMRPDREPKTQAQIDSLHSRIDYKAENDPHQLVRAQINNKEADELHLRAKTTTGKSPLDFGTELHEIGINTAAAYRDAAYLFETLNIPASKLIAQELNRAANEMGRQK